MVRVKFCGIRSLSDALAAARLGVNALGFIFLKGSNRYIEPEKAAEIVSSLPPLVMRVGVFVDQEIAELEDIAGKCRLDIVQLHGEESSKLCAQLRKRYRVIKTFKVKDKAILSKVSDYIDVVDAVLLDTFSADTPGGTGKSFDWRVAKELKSFGLPVILSGGLNPENIKTALREVNPYAVDVSSGIEKSPGVKDHELMGKFIASLWEEEWGL
jgi:phosphoribosylanthranilate isomerase